MMKIPAILLSAMLLVLASCSERQTAPSDNSVFVVRKSEDTGITFSNDLKEGDSLNIVEYLYYYNGGGVAIGDINGDGLEDIYFSANESPDRLYLNKGNLKFEDITSQSGIANDNGWSSGVAMDDINGDGYMDIYVCKVSLLNPEKNYHNLLYINNGKGQFTEMSAAYGLNFTGYSTQSCFIDYDKDGDLDMYLLNHAVHSVRSYGDTTRRRSTDPVSGDVFFENRLKEDGKFHDVTKKTGIYNSPLGYGLAITAADVNNDGWTDIYIGNDFHENDYLYINNGDKTFTESIASAFTNTTQFSMGVDIADMDNDGFNDVFSTDMMPYDAGVVLKSGGEDSDQVKRIKSDLGFELQNARNHFQVNSGDGTFKEIACLTQTFATDWSWSVLLQDFNNDMNNDIFITNGIVKRPNDLDYINYLNANSAGVSSKQLIEQMPSQPLSNILFLNDGQWEYTPLSSSLIGPPSFSTGAAFADLDNDGDLDVVINNINENAFLMENLSSAKTNYLTVKLIGGEQMPVVKGSRVSVFQGDITLTRELETIKGYQSSSSHYLHFGLDNISGIDSVVVQWPDFSTGVYHDVKINQEVTFKYQPQKFAVPIKQEEGLKTALVLPFQHLENGYYDENMEKLIPERLAYEGPALLCEDLNGDGITDIFIGGARNQKAQLLMGTPQGYFENANIIDFNTDAKYEDIDAASIDFDGDGDRDIYVVSGGNDNRELNKLLEDRIYLNNGRDGFKRIPLSLPHTNGSCIAVADFDNDGYEDMFVGASTIPGSYGLSPYSFVLKNMKGQGVDIAYKIRYGMVKDAAWNDIDADGDVDLIMCGDWMKIRIFQNDAGQLTEITNEVGLRNSYGFWNTLEFTDINGDGRTDFLAGNSGINQKWFASDSLPIKLYVGDFDGNGSSDPLIFYSYFGRYLPFASLDKLLSQLPILKKKFVSYDSYKDVGDINDLIDNAEEKIVEYKNVTELRSMVYIYENGIYKGYPLGRNEQLSSINDFEVNGDGKIYYTGNNMDYVAELGPSLSNSGRILGGFENDGHTFTQSEKLPVPLGINGRRLCKLSDNSMILVTNNGYPYIINTGNEPQ